jgi:hypothetical protein
LAGIFASLIRDYIEKPERRPAAKIALWPPMAVKYNYLLFPNELNSRSEQ